MFTTTLPVTLLLSLLSSTFLLLPQATTARAFASTPQQFGYFEPRFFVVRQSSTNLQTFTGALGGKTAAAITNSGNTERPFSVDGDTFTDFSSAAQRTCDNQFNDCADAANAQGNKGSFKVSDCEAQKSSCNSAQSKATVTSFDAQTTTAAATENIGPDPVFPDFDLICEV